MHTAEERLSNIRAAVQSLCADSQPFVASNRAETQRVGVGGQGTPGLGKDGDFLKRRNCQALIICWAADTSGLGGEW